MPILATAPAAPLARSLQANSGDAGETSVSDDARAGRPENRLLPLEITVPTPPVEQDLSAAGNVTVEAPPLRTTAGLPGSMGLSPPPVPPPNDPRRDMPPAAEQNSGFAPVPQDARLPRAPQSAGFAPGAPNAGLPPPNQPDRPQPTDSIERSHSAESAPYVPPLLAPIRVAGLDARGPSSSPGPPPDGQSPGGTGSAGACNGLTAAGPQVPPGGTGSAGAFNGSATGPPPTTTSSGPASEKQLCEGAEKVAQVGSQVILASDLKVAVNIWMENQKKSKKPLPPDYVQQHHTEIEISLLKEMTEEVMLYQDILRQVPEEALKNVRDKVSEAFENEELPKRIKNAGVASRGEMEEKLEKLGTSLEREKRTFTQTVLAQQWLQQQVKSDDDTFTPKEVSTIIGSTPPSSSIRRGSNGRS